MDKLDQDYLSKMGEKIKKYRKRIGMTQEELASAAGYKDRSAISIIEKGKSDISRDRFMKIANALNIDVSVLLFDQDGKEDHIIVECESVPILSKVTPTASETVGTVDLPSSIDGDYIGYIMDDDSMDPYIQINDILIIKKQPYAAPDDVVLISVNGENSIVRRFQRERKTILLFADNSKYKPMVFPPDGADSLSMIGIIKEIRRKV